MPPCGDADAVDALAKENPRRSEGFKRADDGIRTHDLLHGNPARTATVCNLLQRKRATERAPALAPRTQDARASTVAQPNACTALAETDAMASS